MASDWRRDYWIECVASGAEECGAVLTREQIEAIAGTVQGGHESFGMVSGDDVADSNLSAARDREKDDLKKALQRERYKIHCRECDGRGAITLLGPSYSSTSQCFKCHGEGRHDP